MRSCLIFSILSIYLPLTYSILDGDRVDWNRHGYLAKVIGRDSEKNFKLCTGAIISGSLVLTASDCVTDFDSENKNLEEFTVVIQIKHHKRRHLAMLVQKTETWAVLRMETIPTEKLCPPSPQPKKVVRMNFSPSLHEASQVDLTADEVLDSKCYLFGFKTEDEPIEFFKTKESMRLDLEKLMSPRTGDSLYRSKIQGNETACYEDVGAPLICNTKSKGVMLVGIFQNLGSEIGTENDVKVKQAPTELNSTVCSNAYEMQFSLIQNDPRLIKLIESEDMGPFVDVYDKCSFINQK